MTVTDRQIAIIAFLQSTLKNSLRGISKLGFLTKEQAKAQEQYSRKIVTHSWYHEGKNYWFLSDDHMYGYLNEKNKLNAVPRTAYLPQTVVPREGLEDGSIYNLEQYLFIFQSGKDDVFVETFDQLIKLLDEHGIAPN